MLVDSIGYCLLCCWAVVLGGLGLPGGPTEDDELVALMAHATPKFVEAWWISHKHVIPTWKTQGVFEKRALHLTLLSEVTITSIPTPNTPVTEFPVMSKMCVMHRVVGYASGAVPNIRSFFCP